MKKNFSKCTWVFSLFAMTLFVSQAIMAQDALDEGRTKLDWGDWPGSVSVGAGVRASYNTGDPLGTMRKDFSTSPTSAISNNSVRASSVNKRLTTFFPASG